MALDDTVRVVLEKKGDRLWSVAPEASVYEALEMMAEHDVGALMVISEREIVGVFSERDYARKIILLGKSSRDTTVREIMTSPAITVGPEQTVNDCMQLMTRMRIRHLPVVQEGVVIGVVSIGDVVNWTIQRQEEQIEHLNRFIVGAYPA
jgi:CBS domain-containing protein